MNPSQVIDETKKKLQAAVDHLGDELKKLRTGRAHASMLDGVMVSAYGQQMPLIQVAQITAPEAQLLQVTPFDPSNIQAIASAIRDNPALGLNPTDDGRVVRVPIPQLTSERRQQLTKQLGEKLEDCMIAQRNVRHEMLRSAKQAKDDKAISEDEFKRLEKQLDEAMAEAKTKAEAAAKAKEQDILTV
jgi:ribosome recycling factor